MTDHPDNQASRPVRRSLQTVWRGRGRDTPPPGKPGPPRGGGAPPGGWGGGGRGPPPPPARAAAGPLYWCVLNLSARGQRRVRPAVMEAIVSINVILPDLSTRELP